MKTGIGERPGLPRIGNLSLIGCLEAEGVYNKAQYLVIQARTLNTIGTTEATEAALELADMVVRDYPDASQLADAHFLRAECLLQRDDPNEGLAAFRNSMQAQRNYPKVHTLVHEAFARLVATKPLPKLYREAVSVLDEFAPGNWQCCPERAMIYSGLKDHQLARRWACFALIVSGPYYRHGVKCDAIADDMRACVEKIAGEKVLGTTYYDLLVLIDPESDFSFSTATQRLKNYSSLKPMEIERKSTQTIRLRFPDWALLFEVKKGPSAALMNGWLAEQVPHPTLPQEWLAACDRRVRISSEDSKPDMDTFYNDFLLAVDMFFEGCSGILRFDPKRHWDSE